MEFFLDTTGTIPEGMGFAPFGPLHLCWLGGFLAAAVLCSLLYRRLQAKGRRAMRLVFAVLLIADELFKVICLASCGNYSPPCLPLHLCGRNIVLMSGHAV